MLLKGTEALVVLSVFMLGWTLLALAPNPFAF